MAPLSIRRDGAWVKQQRIKAIHKMIQGAGEAQLSKVLALCSYKFGLSKATARQYLQVLEDLGFIEVDEDNDFVGEISETGN
ncbi:hypothetical protein ES703_120899 [subsurface metagenome]